MGADYNALRGFSPSTQLREYPMEREAQASYGIDRLIEGSGCPQIFRAFRTAL